MITYKSILTIFWLLGVLSYLILRLYLKKHYKDLHNEIYGEFISDHSIKTSISYIKFSLFFNQYALENSFSKKTLCLLHINRLIFVTFLVMFIGIFVPVILNLIKL